jgi:hypothetical protein
VNLSDFLTSINSSKENLVEKDPICEKEYIPFVVNKCLSYFPDTIFYANQINVRPGLDKKMQYDYLRLSVSKRKRFSKWFKEEKNDNIKLIQEYYGYSYRRAKEVLECLTDDNIRTIKDSLKTGGVKS